MRNTSMPSHPPLPLRLPRLRGRVEWWLGRGGDTGKIKVEKFIIAINKLLIKNNNSFFFTLLCDVLFVLCLSLSRTGAERLPASCLPLPCLWRYAYGMRDAP